MGNSHSRRFRTLCAFTIHQSPVTKPRTTNHEPRVTDFLPCCHNITSPRAGMAVEDPGEHEQEIGERFEVLHDQRGDLTLLRQRDQPALGAAVPRCAQRARPAAREPPGDEVLERRQQFALKSSSQVLGWVCRVALMMGVAEGSVRRRDRTGRAAHRRGTPARCRGISLAIRN